MKTTFFAVESMDGVYKGAEVRVVLTLADLGLLLKIYQEHGDEKSKMHLLLSAEAVQTLIGILKEAKDEPR